MIFFFFLRKLGSDLSNAGAVSTVYRTAGAERVKDFSVGV